MQQPLCHALHDQALRVIGEARAAQRLLNGAAALRSRRRTLGARRGLSRRSARLFQTLVGQAPQASLAADVPFDSQYGQAFLLQLVPELPRALYQGAEIGGPTLCARAATRSDNGVNALQLGLEVSRFLAQLLVLSGKPPELSTRVAGAAWLSGSPPRRLGNTPAWLGEGPAADELHGIVQRAGQAAHEGLLGADVGAAFLGAGAPDHWPALLVMAAQMAWSVGGTMSIATPIRW